MSRRPFRIATTKQLEHSVREAGYEAYVLPDLPSFDFHRTLEQRATDGAIFRPFLEKNDIDLVLDFNTEALTFVPSPTENGKWMLTTAALGIPYVAGYLDPVTSTMGQVGWADHWHLLENSDWIKWIWESAHADELSRMGVPNIVTMPMGACDDTYDRGPLPTPSPGPVVAFMGHPASSWFASDQTISSKNLLAGLTAAAVRADMPDLPFHKIYYDLYGFAEPVFQDDGVGTRAQKSNTYFNQKFIYNAYLAIKQRDRFARFLKLKLGDAFELIGDHWQTHCGLNHTPRIWDMPVLHKRMRQVPICLNLMKGCLESGLNIRHFEITAYGGFMLTYETAELGKSFEIGKECDVFHNEQELLEKIGYYVEHDDLRREIAAAGQRRTLSEHLYSHRIRTLVDLLCKGNVLPKPSRREEPEAATASRQLPKQEVTTRSYPIPPSSRTDERPKPSPVAEDDSSNLLQSPKGPAGASLRFPSKG